MSEQHWKDKIETKLDEISETNKRQELLLLELKINNERNTDILAEHQRRSIASENRHDVVEGEIVLLQSDIRSHLSFIRGAIWLGGAVLAGLGVYKTLVSLGVFS